MKSRRPEPLSARRRTALFCIVVAVAAVLWFYVWRAGLDAELKTAVETRNAAWVHELLNRGADARGTVSYTPAPNPVDFFRAYLRTRGFGVAPGWRPNPANPLNRVIPRSLLEHAIAVGNLQIAADLLNHGADPNYAREDGSTLLFLAAEDGRSPDFARALLRHGARVNARNAGGESALHLAARSDATARLLLDSGAGIEARNISGQTPLHCAVASAPTVRLLLDRGADIHAKDSFGDTPLALASRYRAAESVSLLLDQGADLADLHRRPADRPLLWIAARDGVPLLKRTWEGVLSPQQRAEEGPDALLVAVWSDNKPAVEYLLGQGVDVNAEQARAQIPQNLFETASAPFGFPPRLSTSSWPRFPLLVAATHSRDAELYRLLLAHGARPNAPGTSGSTPLMAAVYVASGGGASSQGAQIPLSTSNRQAWRSIVYRLLESGVDVRAAGSTGATALHAAVADPALVQLLLATGAKVNARDVRGVTPLMSACAVHSESVERLIAAGAEVNATDNMGATPLMYAVSTMQAGETVKAVRVLLKHGANPNLRDKQGRTALIRASGAEQSSATWRQGPGGVRGMTRVHSSTPKPMDELEPLLTTVATTKH